MSREEGVPFTVYAKYDVTIRTPGNGVKSDNLSVATTVEASSYAEAHARLFEGDYDEQLLDAFKDRYPQYANSLDSSVECVKRAIVEE